MQEQNKIDNHFNFDREPLVSIIVAFYNPGDSFTECINSLLRQNYKNYELLLIDDGSTDGSGAYSKTITEENPHVIYFHQENQGPSSARNLGISKANGTYLTFADADDWVEENHIYTLVHTLVNKDADLSCVRWRRSDKKENANTEKKTILTFKTKDEMFRGVFDGDLYAGYVWNKLYKKSIIDNYGIAFDEEVRVLEDQLFNVQYMRYCSKVAFNMQETYNYRIHASSIMQGEYNSSRTTAIDATIKTMDILKREEVASSILEERTFHAVHLFRNNLKYYGACKDRKNFIATSNSLKQFIKEYPVCLRERMKCYLLIEYVKIRRFVNG